MMPAESHARCREPTLSFNCLGDDNDGRGYLALQTIPLISNDAGDLVGEALAAIHYRQVFDLRQALKNQPQIIAYQNEYGVCLLETAVEAGWIDGMNVLIDVDKQSTSKNLYYALLLAIRYNNMEIVRVTVDRLMTENTLQGEPARAFAEFVRTITGDGDDMARSCDMEITPMALAIHLERPRIIKFLRDRRLDGDLHPVYRIKQEGKCPNTCAVCEGLPGSGRGVAPLNTSRRILAAYRSLVSPYHILSKSVEDPLLETFLVSDYLSQLQTTDIVFAKEYAELGEASRKFAVEWIDLCRTEKELFTLFSSTEGVDSTDLNIDLPRLHVAVDLDQKEFIAHPHYQYALQTVWYKGMDKRIISVPFLGFCVLATLGNIFMPILCLLYGFGIRCVVRFMRVPRVRFFNDTFSYLCFLLLLFIESWAREGQGPVMAGNLPSFLQWVIFIWVFSMFEPWLKLKRCCSRRRHRLISWQSYDPIMQILFMTSFGINIVISILVKCRILDDLPMNLWPNYHAKLIAGAIFSLASFMAFLRLCVYFMMSSIFGPLLISLSLMLKHIVRFLLINAIVYTAFAVALIQVYAPYRDGVRKDVNASEIRRQHNEFTGVNDVYKALFWSLFNYGDSSYADVVVDNSKTTTPATADPMPNSSSITFNSSIQLPLIKHKLTEAVGYVLYASFHIVVIVVLLNLFIATMANSYNIIEANSDKEWRFCRARVILKLACQTGTIPPPYNLLSYLVSPIVKLVWLLIRRTKPYCDCRNRCCCCCTEANRKQQRRKYNEEEHRRLEETLRSRYWYRKRSFVDMDMPAGGRDNDALISDQARRSGYVSRPRRSFFH